MNARLITLCAMLLLSTTVCVDTGAAASKTIRIYIDNQTPDFAVTAFIDKSPSGSEEFTKGKDNKLEYRLPISADRWFARATVRLVWKNALQTVSGPRVDFAQRVHFRFSRAFKDDQAITVFFGLDRTGAEIAKLERLHARGIVNDQAQVLFRMVQIAEHYRSHSGIFKRVANVAFNAAKDLAEYDNSTYELGEDVLKLAIESDPDRQEYFEGLALKVRSNYWNDFNKIYPLAAKGQCEAADLLFRELVARQKEKIEEFTAARIPNNWQRNVSGIIRAKCSKGKNIKKKPQPDQSAMMTAPSVESSNNFLISAARRSSARR